MDREIDIIGCRLSYGDPSVPQAVASSLKLWLAVSTGL